MPPQTLRDYQQRGLRQVLDAYGAGARSVLAVAPTGSGKTTLFGYLAAQLAASGKRALILAHRRELVEQASNRLREFGVQHGIIMAGTLPTPYARVQVASVQTLSRRSPPPADLVVADEAHLSTAKTWHDLLEQYPRARILGVTATPWRLSGKPLAGAYDACVVVATPRELREQGHLSDYVGFSYLTPDLSEVKTTAGEYNEAQSARVMSDSLIVDNIVEEWGKHASALSTVVFAVTVEHSRALTARFRSAGVAAEHLDGSTPLEQRRAILRRVEQGATRVLCNVGVAVEGLDIPRLKCCVLARPTKSLARAIQMMGRVRRPWNGVVARIHDHAFTIRAHGLPDADRDYSLTAKPEAPPSLTTCSECLAVYSGTRCPACGGENEPAPAGERVIQTVADAEKVEFSSTTEEAPVERPAKPTRVSWSTPGRKVVGVYESVSVEERGSYKQKVHRLRAEKRDYELPGMTRLDALLARVPFGSLVEVEYTGETQLGGGKARKEFEVGVDDGEEEQAQPQKVKPPAWVEKVRV